jgi:hypothetical protein
MAPLGTTVLSRPLLMPKTRRVLADFCVILSVFPWPAADQNVGKAFLPFYRLERPFYRQERPF